MLMTFLSVASKSVGPRDWTRLERSKRPSQADTANRLRSAASLSRSFMEQEHTRFSCLP